MSECHGRDSCVPSLRRFERLDERRQLWIDPGFVMKALQQLHARRQAPGELREDLVLLVGSGERRVGAGLAVVVAQVLIADEEPGPIANNRTTKIRRQVTIPVALVSALRCARPTERTTNRLAREACRLRIVRRVIQQPRAALPCHNVDDGALNVAEFSRRTGRLDLDFLNEIDARLGARDAVARAREVGAVDQKLILVRTGPER